MRLPNPQARSSGPSPWSDCCESHGWQWAAHVACLPAGTPPSNPGSGLAQAHASLALKLHSPVCPSSGEPTWGAAGPRADAPASPGVSRTPARPGASPQKGLLSALLAPHRGARPGPGAPGRVEGACSGSGLARPAKGLHGDAEAGAAPGACRRASGSDSDPGMWWPFAKLTQAVDPNPKYLERVVTSSGRQLGPVTEVGQHRRVPFHREQVFRERHLECPCGCLAT